MTYHQSFSGGRPAAVDICKSVSLLAIVLLLATTSTRTSPLPPSPPRRPPCPQRSSVTCPGSLNFLILLYLLWILPTYGNGNPKAVLGIQARKYSRFRYQKHTENKRHLGYEAKHLNLFGSYHLLQALH